MKTPITEHPEFVKDKKNDFKVLFDGKAPTREKDAYDAGAQAAQSILNEEHDREMEEFTIWYELTSFTKLHDGWVDVNTEDCKRYTFKELLELFRYIKQLNG